ncbi:TetR/AcrR family transcriptional regulator [Aminomonas paucivorans]|uniref:TetR/AcrR family transcriptional regulator n=1 Tax=Aminomonas paucivorans TaxID=81412 RepID=UPI0033287052
MSRTPAPSAPAPARRESILDAAEDLFLRQGYEGTSVHQVVQRVGIAQGTFYYHFPSKEAVLDALVERALHPFGEAAQTRATEDRPPWERVVEVLSQVLRIRSERGPLMAYIHREGNLKLHETFLRRVKERFGPLLVSLLEEGMASGTLHVHAPEETASFLLVTAEYLFDSPHWLGDPTVYEAQLKVAASVVEGLLGLPHDAVDLDLLGGRKG